MAIVPKNLIKWGAKSPTPRPNAHFVRLKHPRDPGTYYSKREAAWVQYGWTVWTYEDWRATFGNQEDNFNWEFFGYRIPLVDDETLD